MIYLDIWNKVSQAPDWALKQIEGGRLKGKTDINPMWRNMCMTEHFGMCGFGWKYEIVKTWTHELKDNPTVTVFVLVNVYVKQGAEWSEPIPSVGGDVLAEMQKGSLFVNDDCYKMAITDALGKAFAMLGVAANTYRKAESKYIRQNEQQQQQPKGKQPEQKKAPLPPKEAHSVILSKAKTPEAIKIIADICEKYLSELNKTKEKLTDKEFSELNNRIITYKKA